MIVLNMGGGSCLIGSCRSRQSERNKGGQHEKVIGIIAVRPTLTVEKKQKRCKACKYRADSVFKVYM